MQTLNRVSANITGGLVGISYLSQLVASNCSYLFTINVLTAYAHVFGEIVGSVSTVSLQNVSFGPSATCFVVASGALTNVTWTDVTGCT